MIVTNTGILTEFISSNAVGWMLLSSFKHKHLRVQSNSMCSQADGNHIAPLVITCPQTRSFLKIYEESAVPVY